MPNQRYYGDKYNQGDFNWTTKFGKKKSKTEGEKIDTGTYTEEGPIDTGELGPDGKPLMSATNPLDDLTIDPNRKTLTESEKRLQDKLRRRAGTGQQGADLAKEKLEKKGGSATDLPQFLQSAEMDETYKQDIAENADRDKEIRDIINSTEKGSQERLQGLKEIAKKWGSNALGYGLMGLQKYGEAVDWTNDQVNLRNTLRIGNFKTPFDALLNYSYKDLRDDIAGGMGNVVGAATGSETANDITETVGQILLPDAMDFIGGVGYLDNIVRAASKVDDILGFSKRFKRIIKHTTGGKKVELVDASTGMVIEDRTGYYKTFLESRSIKGSKNPNQLKLPVERFQSISYKESVISKMTPFGGSMKKGVMDVNAVDSVKLGDKKQRAMLESFLSPDRIAGSFDGFGKANRPGFAEKWADFLKAKGLDPVGDVQIHHINPLYDSIHLFDGVKFDSKEYWDTIEALIQGNARTGIIHRGEDVNNLMMTLGKGKAVNTPHGIAHKYLNAQTPTFFSKAEMKLMKADPAYRLQKADEWAEIVVKSEEIILEAHKQWSLLNPKTASKLSFDEIVDTLSEYTDQGYSKLLSSEYQLPDFNRIITQIAKDKGLKGPIFRLQPPPVRDPSKVTQLEKMTKEADIINELKSINRTPKPVDPNQTKLDI